MSDFNRNKKYINSLFLLRSIINPTILDRDIGLSQAPAKPFGVFLCVLFSQEGATGFYLSPFLFNSNLWGFSK